MTADLFGSWITSAISMVVTVVNTLFSNPVVVGLVGIPLALGVIALLFSIFRR